MKPSYKTSFVWQASVDVAARVLQLTEAFSNRRLALADQMQRAATSVPSNIAEGHGRLTERERRRFLGIARGSLHELDTQLEIAVRAGLIPATTQAELMTVLPRIGAGINTMIRKLNLSMSHLLMSHVGTHRDLRRLMATKKAKKPTDAIALLKQDHETVRGLLERATKSSGERRSQTLAKIEKELKVHTQIEEEIFYPAYRDAVSKKDDRKLYFEAVEEHRVVDLVMPDVENGTDEEVAAHVKVLKELVEHHADEEEKSMFPKARKVLERDELRALGEQLKARKKALGG